MNNDNDNQHSFGKAAAVLAGIGGAVAFRNLGGAKFLADELPKMGKFLGAIADDLSDMARKDFTAERIGGLMEKHVLSDNSTWNTIRDAKPIKHKINTFGKSFVADLVKMNEIKANPRKYMQKLFNSEYTDEIVDELSEKFGLEDEDFLKRFRSFTSHVVEKNDLIKMKSLDESGKEFIEWNTDLIDRYLNKDESGEDFFLSLLEKLENKDNAFNDFLDKASINGGNLSEYDFIDNILKEFSAENLKRVHGKDSDDQFFQKVLGNTRAMTLNDYMNRSSEFEEKILDFGEESKTIKELIGGFLEKNPEYGDILLDPRNLRIDANGDIVNLRKINEATDNTLRTFAGTLPGKLAKVTDYLNVKESSSFNIFTKGKSDLIGESVKTGKSILSDNYAQVLGRYYRIESDRSITHIAKMDEMYSISSKHGTIPRMMKKMSGTEAEKVASNKITDFLDINTVDESNILHKMAKGNGITGAYARKVTGIERKNVIDELFNFDAAVSSPEEYRRNAERVSDIFSHIVKTPNKKTITKLQNHTDNEVTKELLGAILLDDTDEMVGILNKHANSYRNQDLVTLVKVGAKDRQTAAKMLSIKDDRLSNGKTALKYRDMVKREVFKEALLNEVFDSKDSKDNFDNILISLRRAGINGEDYENSKKMAHWANLQYQGKLFSNMKNATAKEALDEYNAKVVGLINEKGSISKNGEYAKDLAETLQSIKKNYKAITTTHSNKKRAKVMAAEATNDAIMMRKGYSPRQFALDMIKDQNDFTKQKAHAKKFGMQFVAGRKNPEYVTSYTMVPYFLTQRLIEPFNEFGLGFSNKNMGSVGSQWKAIMTKRVMPFAIGATALSYLNYEVKNFTGTSITGAMAQGIANVDLGIRKIADKTGIGSILEAERKLNPISQYWLGEDYQNSEERKDYYENGYDAVRKSRWWSFGSASEFRGGKISYFQPNYVKRATSDWKDIGLYGSSKEKWKHSWMPTIRHPLAPVRRLLDPYWLEKKHYNDRPYLETAPLFSTGTPWGAVLNPTIGEVIKPIKRMHKNEVRRGMVDPRVLIQERNERIKARAIDKNRNNLVKVGQNGITNISFTPKALADPSGTMITLKAGEGRIQSVDYNGVGYEEGIPELNGTPGIGYEGVAEGDASGTSEYGSVQDGYIRNNIKTSSGIMDYLESTAIGSSISNQVNRNFESIGIIRQQNYEVKRKAAAKRTGFTKEVNLADMPAKQASQRILTREDEADLRLTTSKHDFINDAIFSGKQLNGIYTFIAGSFAKDKGRQIRPENAEKMSSFKRGFWDANVGGLGGGIMEIARRFFPHDDHSWTDINPIRNTMPEWMPKRFQVGDPYVKVPKGEMRLPGAGYESIHKLTPDAYGKYGALDRMRILADIAPWSDEYKLWRDIAQKTVTHKKGVEEIEAIKKRVEKQSKSHEFYNYKFLNTPTQIDNETVDTVEGTKFTTISGKTYNLAGISLGKDVDINQFLQSGMEVRVESLKGDKDEDKPIEASVYVDGTNLNQRLSKMPGVKSDISSVMGAKALTGQVGQLYGATMEAIAHAPIPFIHNKLMRIDTPLESYKNEKVYGAPYSTWDHPIKGFVKPGFQKTFARGAVGQGIALGSWVLAESLWKNADKTTEALKLVGIDISKTSVNKIASIVFNAANPGAFAGSMIASIPMGLMGGEGVLKELLSSAVFGAAAENKIARTGARLGASVMLAGYGITRSDKPIESTAIFSLAGIALSKQLKHEKFGTSTGAMAGAATGLLISAIRNPKFDKDKMFGKYIPKDTKKRWDIDEYYDRLEYIKYQGLYEKAARKARILEGTNIKNIINSENYLRKINSKKIDKLNNRLQKVSNSNLEDGRKQELLSKINNEISRLSTSEQVFRAGKYTKAAIAYKQAADSTMYGLQENATSQQVIRAIPKGDKDFFMEFIKEKDKKKRREILKYVSPYQRRALQIAWGEKKIDKVESNSDYFKNHFLPGTFWAGWSPQIDMEHVKMKTIENEGMLLSDFGIYESQSEEPAAVSAPGIPKFDEASVTGSIALQSRLQGALHGAGLLGVKVSVSPTSANGIEVFANIVNGAKIAEYGIREGINKVIGTRLFY